MVSSKAQEASLRFGTLPSEDIVPFARIDNVIRVYDASNELQRQRGVHWYENERQYARALADTHWRKGSPRTVDTACGILAALSPMVPWEYAKQLALITYRENGLDGGHYGQFREKANRIYLGEDPREVLGGPKVRAFYTALGSGGTDPDAVVVDRHAAHAAVGDVLTTPQRRKLLYEGVYHSGYETVANTYRAATRIINQDEQLSLTPSQLQAIVWVTWRDWLLGEDGDGEW